MIGGTVPKRLLLPARSLPRPLARSLSRSPACPPVRSPARPPASPLARPRSFWLSGLRANAARQQKLRLRNHDPRSKLGPKTCSLNTHHIKKAYLFLLLFYFYLTLTQLIDLIKNYLLTVLFLILILIVNLGNFFFFDKLLALFGQILCVK